MLSNELLYSVEGNFYLVSSSSDVCLLMLFKKKKKGSEDQRKYESCLLSAHNRSFLVAEVL